MGPPGHVYFGVGSFVLALASGVVGIALPLVGVDSAILGYVLFGVAGLLTVIGIAAFALGIRSWIKGLQRELGRLQDAALQEYIDKMNEWIADKRNPLATSRERQKMARTETLTVLDKLGPKHKGRVLWFLRENDLINQESPIVHLHRADCSGAFLRGENLVHTLLTSVNLSDADLRGAKLSGSVSSYEDEVRAQEPGVHIIDLARIAGGSWLELADLSGTDFRKARLAGCNLMGTKLKGAKLDKADIRGADLRSTEGLTQKQIKRAYGSYEHDGLVPGDDVIDTMLPRGLEPPEAWRRPFSEQRRKRGDL